MRYIVIVALLLAAIILPTHAQSTFVQGFYEFENVVGSMAYTGTWASISPSIGGTGRTTTTVASSVSFYSAGDTVVIWRFMRNAGNLSKMDVCAGASCVNVVNETTAANSFWYPYVLYVTPGQLLTITLTSGQIILDSLMILSSSGGTFPTPVPTATILPSSTPAFTATPAPTSTPGNTPVPTATILPSSTPAPTSTPYTLPGAIIAIDPAAKYSSTNGQVTKQTYGMETTDYMMLYLLAALLGVNVIQIGLTIWKRK